MNLPEVKPGDIFCSRNPMALGRAICAVQSFWDRDGEAEYSHAGLILDSAGTSFESLWTVKNGNIYNDYRDGIIIGRHKSMSSRMFNIAFNGVTSQRVGQIYPFYRLLFHLFPPIAKVSLGRVVCSELVAEFLYACSIMGFWKGVTPSYLVDIIRRWKWWKIMYEGNLNDIIGD